MLLYLIDVLKVTSLVNGNINITIPDKSNIVYVSSNGIKISILQPFTPPILKING